MSKSEIAIMKMPANAKLVESSTQNVNYSGYYDSGTKGMATAFSVTWLSGAGTVAGFYTIPLSSGFIGIPITLSIIAGIIGFCTGFFFLADGTASNIRKYKKTQSSELISSKSFGNPSALKSGVQISGWDKGAGEILTHFLLPVRIFKKIKVYESVKYSPYEDQYVKETHYLTFSGFVRVKEKFDGHRAVFQKAIDSF